METTSLRQEIAHLVFNADDEVVRSIYASLQAQLQLASGHWSDNPQLVAQMQSQVEACKEGNDPAYSWEEVKRAVEAQRTGVK